MGYIVEVVFLRFFWGEGVGGLDMGYIGRREIKVDFLEVGFEV